MKVDELVDIASRVSEALDGEEVPREVVMQMLNGVVPGTIFNDQVNLRKAQGWTWGEEYDEDRKTDPLIVVYGELDPQRVARYEAVHAVVYSLRHYITVDNPDDPVVPPGLQQTMTARQRERWEEENETTLPDSVLVPESAQVQEKDQTEEKSFTIPPSGFNPQ